MPVPGPPTAPPADRPTAPAADPPTAPAADPPTVPAADPPTAPAADRPTVPAADGRDGEEWRRPSPRLGRMRRAEVGLVGLVALALAAGLAGAFGSPVAVGASVAGVVVAAGLADNLLQRRVRSWGYLERADDLLVRRGVMVRRLSVVPYGRMQFVDVDAGLVERAFRLATARLHTAAAAGDVRVPGLEASEAARLRDRLAALGEAKGAGL